MLISAVPAWASEELVTTAHKQDGEVLPYILNHEGNSPKYVVILFPGGSGAMGAHMENGELVYAYKGNFVIKARRFLVDADFATAAMDASQVPSKIQAVIDDLKSRYPAAQLYLMSTSKGTYDSMALAPYLSDKIAGIIHTSSFEKVASFDPRPFKNRHLLVHHRDDTCRSTPFRAAQRSHEKYGTELIVMEGGTSQGDLCEPAAHHGFAGIHKPTVEAIKAWIRKGHEAPK